MAELNLDRLAPVGIEGTYAQEVATRLRAAITKQHLQPGDTLPGEDRIGAALRVSRPVVRLALDDLEEAGLITRRKGHRTVISPCP